MNVQNGIPEIPVHLKKGLLNKWVINSTLAFFGQLSI